jgi:hypothetical protein
MSITYPFYEPLRTQCARRRGRRLPAARLNSGVAEFHYAEKAWLRNQCGIGPIQSEEVND